MASDCNCVLKSFLLSGIGRKAIMAATGVIMVGFVIGHMVGNLQFFMEPKAINDYAHFLKSTPALLWGTRIVLLISVILHMYCAITLARENAAAKPSKYVYNNTVKASWSSRLTLLSGLVILAFIVFHILHFTTLSIDSSYANLKTRDGHHDVHSMMVKGFEVGGYAWFYVVAVILLGLHTCHGIWSLFQTLGLNTSKTTKVFALAALGLSIVVTLGFIAIPLSVQFGLVS